MNIDELSDQEKSVLLARMLKESMLPDKYLPVMSPEFKPVNLYDPANMALAWRVHLWALQQDFYDSNYLSWLVAGDGWADSQLWWYLEDAQRAWLDKVLTLALEAGLVESDHAS